MAARFAERSKGLCENFAVPSYKVLCTRMIKQLLHSALAKIS